MKIYIRYSFHIKNEEELSLMDLAKLKQMRDEYFIKCHLYSIDDGMYLVRVPIDSAEYELILEYYGKNKQHAYELKMYEFEYTKKEKESAEYLLLQCRTIVVPYEDFTGFSYCCSSKKIRTNQYHNTSIKESDMKNRIIVFTSGYRFMVSPEVKEECERQQIRNIVFEPVYTKRKKLVAYYIESDKKMQELQSINCWHVMNRCDDCGKEMLEGVHTVPHPFLIPTARKDDLQDFNSTSDQFTEVMARYYVISKKMYQILIKLGAKNLICQPIDFIE